MSHIHAYTGTNTIIYFNSLILSNLLTHYSEIGDEVNLELVKKVGGL